MRLTSNYWMWWVDVRRSFHYHNCTNLHSTERSVFFTFVQFYIDFIFRIFSHSNFCHDIIHDEFRRNFAVKKFGKSTHLYKKVHRTIIVKIYNRISHHKIVGKIKSTVIVDIKSLLFYRTRHVDGPSILYSAISKENIFCDEVLSD